MYADVQNEGFYIGKEPVRAQIDVTQGWSFDLAVVATILFFLGVLPFGFAMGYISETSLKPRGSAAATPRANAPLLNLP
jgi:hypothetical protein